MTHSIFRRTGRKGFTLKYRDLTGHAVMRAFRTRGEAEDEAIRLRQRPATGKVVTLNDHAKAWIKHAALGLRPGTTRGYRWALNKHILPQLGHLKMQELTRPMVKDFLGSKDKLARKTLYNVAQVLRTCLQEALNDGVIYTNPAAGTNARLAPIRARAALKVKAFDADQLRRFLEAARAQLPERFVLFRFMALTGVRLGEALALQWDDVDLEGRKAGIRQGWTEGEIQPTKTGRERTVDLAKVLCDEFETWSTSLKAAALKSGKPMASWVFPSSVGTPIAQGYIRDDFKTAAKKAKLPGHHTPHSLRHTYASLQLQAGEPLYYVQRQLGHATIAMTTDLYGRWLPSGNPEAADRLAGKLSPAVTKGSKTG